MLTLLPVLAFVFGTMLITGAAYFAMSRQSAAVDHRLREVTSRADGRPAHVPGARLTKAVARLGERAPRSTREVGPLQQRLIHAGFRRSDALPIFLGIRVAVAAGAFALVAMGLFMRANTAIALAALGAGYIVPGMVLARLAKRRQHRIRMGLADTLDLLVVSVEAGLGLDQALARVSAELVTAYPELSAELRTMNLELRAGTARTDALRHLADRTGVDDLEALVAMLVQTDKFGTSVANSLRVYSDTLRTKRRQRAEEAAAKTGVKMVFPLVLCIFPAIWIVTIGPAVIQFVRVLFPLIEGTR